MAKGGFKSGVAKFLTVQPKQAESVPAETPETEAKAQDSKKPVKRRSKAQAQTAPSLKAAPEGMKPNPAYIEKRTQRLQLVLQPSLFVKVKEAAQAQGSSVNDYVHSLLEQATGTKD